MRVLLLTDSMPQGGAERQLSYLAIMFKKRGYDIRLIKFYSGNNFYQLDLDDYGIKTETIMSAQKAFIRPFIIAKIVKKWKPQLVITYKDGTSIAACLAKLLTPFNLAVSERNTTQKLSIKERIKFQLYRLANHIIPNSFSQAEFIKNHAKWLTQKVHVITNMIDTSKFNTGNNLKNNSHLQIVTMARIAPQKNILNYLEAIAIIKTMFPNVYFDWYGREEHIEYYNQVKDKSEKLGVTDIITFHGSITNVVDVYQKADIFCLPSNYEGFPNALCEAMACGLTAIASDVCDNPRILLSSERRFNPNDVSSIVKTLTTIIKTSEKTKYEEGLKNREYICQLCSPESFIQKHINLIS